MELDVLLSRVEIDHAISQINIDKVPSLEGIPMELLQGMVRVGNRFFSSDSKLLRRNTKCQRLESDSKLLGRNTNALIISLLSYSCVKE